MQRACQAVSGVGFNKHFGLGTQTQADSTTCLPMNCHLCHLLLNVNVSIIAIIMMFRTPYQVFCSQ